MATEVELAWLAGLFDGEGCVSISKSTKKRVGGTETICHNLVISITNNDEKAMTRIMEITGEGKTYFRDNGQWGKIWQWQTSALIAVRILDRMMPYLVVKKRESEIGLELAKTKNVRLTYRTSPEIIALRDKLKDDLHQEKIKRSRKMSPRGRKKLAELALANM